MAFLLRSPLSENTDAELAQDLLDGGPIIFEPALVGRDAELKTLDNLCKNTLREKGESLRNTIVRKTLKSRLLEQALAIGRSQNLDVFVSYCDAEDKSPFQPFIKIVDKNGASCPKPTIKHAGQFPRKVSCYFGRTRSKARRLNDPTGATKFLTISIHNTSLSNFFRPFGSS